MCIRDSSGDPGNTACRTAQRLPAGFPAESIAAQDCPCLLYTSVFTHVREYFFVIDRDFIYEIGVLYLSIAAQAMIVLLL